LVGKSKPTISNAIKNGKLSAEKVDGVFQIEKSELVRVWPEKAKAADAPKPEPKATGGSAVAALEKKHLEERVAELEARLAKAEDKAETAEAREREANARVFALIEDKRPKSLWQKVLGK
jgi:hypothetical protein